MHDHKIYTAQWKGTHRERNRSYSKKWYDSKGKTKRRETYQLKREELLAKQNAYNATRRKENVAATRRYKKLHPEKTAESDRQRRAKIHNALVNDFTAEQWEEMQAAYHHKCVYCQKRCRGKLTQDHITPLSKGGNHTRSNIVPACNSCNASKGSRKASILIQPLLI